MFDDAIHDVRNEAAEQVAQEAERKRKAEGKKEACMNKKAGETEGAGAGRAGTRC
jgi:hypothetical protein